MGAKYLLPEPPRRLPADAGHLPLLLGRRLCVAKSPKFTTQHEYWLS